MSLILSKLMGWKYVLKCCLDSGPKIRLIKSSKMGAGRKDTM